MRILARSANSMDACGHAIMSKTYTAPKRSVVRILARSANSMDDCGHAIMPKTL